MSSGVSHGSSPATYSASIIPNGIYGVGYRGQSVNVLEVDAHHLDIIRLSWSRELGLSDDALSSAGLVSTHVVQGADTVRLVQVADTSVLVGPQWAIDRAAGFTLAELTSPATLPALTQDHAGRCAGPFSLAFIAEYDDDAASTSDLQPLVSHDPRHARQLDAICPPDDVADVRLTGRDRVFVLLDDEQLPLAAAGYTEFQGFLADLAALTPPAHRRRGLGETAARFAGDDALDNGLIAQWCAHRNNLAARELGRALGYEELGTYITVAIAPSSI